MRWLPRRRVAQCAVDFLLAVALAALLPPAGGPAASVRTSSPHRPVGAETGAALVGWSPTPDDPLRVWVLGDSVMHDAEPALAAALAATGEAAVVADSSFGGWGLTTVPAWAADSEQIIAAYHPQVVVGTWSWDDTLAGDDPIAYLTLLDRALSVWLAPGDGVQLVLLVQFPQIGPNTFIAQPLVRARLWATLTAEQRAWDTDATRAVQAFPGHARYVTTDQLFDPHDRFLTWAPAGGGLDVRVRQVDNIHLCPFGAAELAQLIVASLGDAVGLRSPVPGWERGPWTLDQRYNIGVAGPGACPADQPLPGYRGLLVPAS
jgi:hypothetical protein